MGQTYQIDGQAGEPPPRASTHNAEIRRRWRFYKGSRLPETDRNRFQVACCLA
ncbi:50S ribosomal protein L32 [Neisseria shayeganii 871]|uniref:50S ribosomal protein L32 n=1 Tax=Neisseria shayeganii 871 TaxID=1032488 RepID=G4CH90_9NEIS|nr:50S ribosomal protein L32 [Neisseria shayeganii 871]